MQAPWGVQQQEPWAQAKAKGKGKSKGQAEARMVLPNGFKPRLRHAAVRLHGCHAPSMCITQVVVPQGCVYKPMGGAPWNTHWGRCWSRREGLGLRQGQGLGQGPCLATGVTASRQQGRGAGVRARPG